jgi:hypothetical protein
VPQFLPKTDKISNFKVLHFCLSLEREILGLGLLNDADLGFDGFVAFP